MAPCSLLYHKNIEACWCRDFSCLCASGWRSTRPFLNKTVVSRGTNEPLRTNWLDAARGVEWLVDSDVTVMVLRNSHL